MENHGIGLVAAVAMLEAARLRAAERREGATAEPERQPRPLTPLRPAAGRNEPCPCGSGVKYKRCCKE